MEQFYPDPGDPAVVDAIVEHQRGLTREQWQARLARIPGVAAESLPDKAPPESSEAIRPIVPSENNAAGHPTAARRRHGKSPV